MIEIRVNADAVGRGLDAAARKQVPFAIAKALTATALAAKSDLIEHLGDTMTIRNRWVSGGIRIKPARKTNLRAEVGSLAKFMAVQATGGERKGKAGGAVAVPVAARKDKAAITKQGKWPGKILAGRGYVAKLAEGQLGVFRRTGKGKRSKTTLFYIMQKKVEVKQHWPLAERVQHTAAKVWPGEIVKSLAAALATVKNFDLRAP